MTLNLLISCMHEKDTNIINRSNVQSDVVVVNQCDHDSIVEFDFENKSGRNCHAKFINTTERGLSRSRNMAIRNAWGDVCLICDDDEVIADDCEEIIMKAYEENPDAGVIAFALIRKDNGKSYSKEKTSLGIKQILKTSSVQVTFRRKLMEKYGIMFDEKMGSGTGNGGGEENKFMLDWRRVRVKMLYYPDIIATVNPGDSQWFKGYDVRFFENQGWIDRRIFGFFVGFIYMIYWPLFHKRKCKKDGLTIASALKHSIKGFFSKR